MMKMLFKAATLASSLALLSVAVTAPAMARTTVAFNFGNVAVGYSDGYWDNSHQWHKWDNARFAREYRTRYHDNYHAMRHDRAPNQGWREH